MAQKLDSRSADFAEKFEALLGQKRETSDDVRETVASIIDDVRARGDAAVIELTSRFDRFDVASKGLAVSETEIEAAWNSVSGDVKEALTIAADRIRAFHSKQLRWIGVGLWVLAASAARREARQASNKQPAPRSL